MGLRVSTELDASGVTKGAASVKRSLNDVDAAMSKTEKRSGKMGQALQGVGYQFSDLIVQIQAGQNPMIAVTQQGSQLIGAFNPMAGLFFTAAGALGTALLPALFNSKSAMEELEGATDRLSETLTIGEDGVITYTDKIARLAEVSEQAARVQIAASIADATEIIRSSATIVDEVIEGYEGWFTNINAVSGQLESLAAISTRTGESQIDILTRVGDTYEGNVANIGVLSDFVTDLNDKLGTSSEQSLRLAKAFSNFERTPQGMVDLADVVATLAEETGFSNSELNKLAKSLQDAAADGTIAQSAIDLLNKTLKNTGVIVEQNSETFQRNSNSVLSLSQQLLVLQTEYSNGARAAQVLEAQQRAGVDASSAQGQQIALLTGQIYDLQESLKPSKSVDPIKLLNQELDVLTTKTEESARAAAILEAQQKAGVTADSERGQTVADLAGKIFDQKEQVKALAQQERDRQKALTEQRVQEERALELAVRTNQSYEDQRAALQRLVDQGRLTQEEFARGMLAVGEQEGSLTLAQGYIQQLDLMQEASNSSFQEIGQQAATIFGPGGTLQQGIADAAAQSIVFGEDFGSTMKQLGLTVASELLSQLIQVGIQQATNAALGATTSQALIASTTASAIASQTALTASAVAAGVASASAWAPAAALASLATLGTNAAPAIAGITAVTAASQIAALPKIGFATGGFVEGGGTGTSDSINARLSRGEFVVRESVTRRNRSALESLNSTGQMPSSGMNVTVINNTPSQVSTSQGDNGDLIVTIDERINKQLPSAMAKEMGNPSSKSRTALARTSNIKRN